MRPSRASTYSRYLAQWAGSDMAMKQQLVRMVHMMKRLNKVLKFRRTTNQARANIGPPPLVATVTGGGGVSCGAAGASQPLPPPPHPTSACWETSPPAAALCSPHAIRWEESRQSGLKMKANDGDLAGGAGAAGGAGSRASTAQTCSSDSDSQISWFAMTNNRRSAAAAAASQPGAN